MAKFLTKDEELHLGGLVQKMLQAKEEIKSDDTLSEDRKQELSCQIIKGEKAVDTMVRANTRLVYKKARSFKESYPGGPELDDIIQDGMAGLMNAILRYDPSRNNKLSTVATYWIFQSISRQANKTGRLVRLPENRVSDFSKISKMRKQFELDGTVNPTDADNFIMNEMKLSKEDFSAIVNAASTPTSLNKEVNNDESARELMDVIPMGTEMSVESHIIKDAMRDVLSDAMENLNEIQKDVLNASFVFDNRKTDTLTPKEVKKKHKINTEVFESHLALALKEIKKEMDANGVTYDDFLDD